MYKSRITKWGLDKKTKETEAWAILRIKAQRNAVGKDSAFRVREKAVTIEDVLRYFKRKGIVHPEVAPKPPEASTPPVIECWTPIPSPRPGVKTIQVSEEEDVQSGADSLHFRGAEMNVVSCTTPDSSPGNGDVRVYLNIDETRQVLFSNPEIQSFEIPLSPLPPQSLLVPEKLFASVKAYYGGAFAGGLFKPDEHGDLINVSQTLGRNQILVKFHELWITGVSLMWSKSFVKGRRCLSKASSFASQVLRGQDPKTLHCILELFIHTRKNGQNQIAMILRNLVDGIAEMLFAEGHPWRQIFSQIASLDNAHFEFALAEAWRCACDIFANLLGQFYPTTIYCYLNFISTVYSSNGSAQLLQNYLIRGEQELGRLDWRLLQTKHQYGWALASHGRKFEAIAILEEVLARCREIGGQKYIVILTLYRISLCQYALGRQHEAESTLHQAIKTAEEAYGKFDSWVLQLKACLEEWLCKWGRKAESAIPSRSARPIFYDLH